LCLITRTSALAVTTRAGHARRQEDSNACDGLLFHLPLVFIKPEDSEGVSGANRPVNLKRKDISTPAVVFLKLLNQSPFFIL
jgi:hypothetical protein